MNFNRSASSLRCEYHHPADTIAVTIEILRRAVHHDIRTQLQRTLQVRRHERIVDDDPSTPAMRDLRDATDIRNRHHRVRRRLDEHHLCIRPHGLLERRQIRRIHIRELDAVVPDDLVEQPECPSVDILRTDRMIALLQQQLRNRRRRGHARRKRICRNPAFQRRHVFLERKPRGVLCPRILVAFVLSETFLNVGGGLKNRRDDGAGRWVGLLPGVNGVGSKSHKCFIVPRRSLLS